MRAGLLVGAAIGGLCALLNVAVHWASVYGPQLWAIPGVELLFLPALLSLLLVPFCVLACALRRTRRGGIAFFSAAMATVVLIVIGTVIGDRTRESGFVALAQRARPLVEAIEDYEAAHGSPPESLDMLPTQVREGLPRFDYHVGSKAEEIFHGNPWALSLDAGTGLLNWDQFIYYPLQNYPERGHGGYLERMGDWAYVYE